MRKKKIGYFIYLVLTLGMCVIPLACMGIRRSTGTAENRALAPLPQPYRDGRLNADYLQELGDYFTDHFAFRQELVTMDARVRAEIFQVSSEDSVIVGTDGWLYYTATLDDFQHKNGVSDRMLFNMAHNLALMQQYTESLGKTFLFTVAPNKNSLYGEHMPARFRYRIGAESDMKRLRPYLEQENVNYIDLYALFKEREEVLYYMRDSHWNQKGAALVSNALLDACGRGQEAYETSEGKAVIGHYGDLDRMLFPADGHPEVDHSYLTDETWTYMQGETVEDDLIRTGSGSGSGNLLMYRDSFGNSLLPYLAERFSAAAFSRQVPYPMTDLITYDPDVVVVEKVERHLPTLGTVPPLMSGPACFPEEERVFAEKSSAFVRLSKEGSYWKLEGLADPSYMDKHSRIYIGVEDEGVFTIYEAFCISLPGEDEGGDYGFLLYLSDILMNGDTIRIQVMTEKEDQIVILHEEDIYLSDSMK